MIVTSERLIPNDLASSVITAALAAPSAGASATRTSSSSRPSAPVRQPPIPGLAERGVTADGDRAHQSIAAWAGAPLPTLFPRFMNSSSGSTAKVTIIISLKSSR
jgi:hypothetical protein